MNKSERSILMSRLLTAWNCEPHLRLGQLLGNSIDGDTYYVEDAELIEAVEAYVAKNGRGHDEQA